MREGERGLATEEEERKKAEEGEKTGHITRKDARGQTVGGVQNAYMGDCL